MIRICSTIAIAVLLAVASVFGEGPVCSAEEPCSDCYSVTGMGSPVQSCSEEQAGPLGGGIASVPSSSAVNRAQVQQRWSSSRLRLIESPIVGFTSCHPSPSCIHVQCLPGVSAYAPLRSVVLLI